MDLLTVKQAAKELDLSERRIRKLCQDGRFGKQYGWQWLIIREEIEEFKKLDRKVGRPPKNQD